MKFGQAPVVFDEVRTDVLEEQARKLNSTELKLVATFPLDFDFKSQNAGKIQYVTGMSVPPVMMPTLADRIYNEFTPLFTT